MEPEDRDPAELIPAHRELFAPLCQQKALALAQLGAYEAARVILQRFWDRGLRDGETEGILARTYKDEAFEIPTAQGAGETGKPRPGRANLSSAAEIYFTGYRLASTRGDRDSAFYCGINAAACAFCLDQHDGCREISLAVLEVLRERAEEASRKEKEKNQKDPLDAWWHATLGEACLYLHLISEKPGEKELAVLERLQGFMEPATSAEAECGTLFGEKALWAYKKAAGMIAGRYRELATMKLQVKRVAIFSNNRAQALFNKILDVFVLP